MPSTRNGVALLVATSLIITNCSADTLTFAKSHADGDHTVGSVYHTNIVLADSSKRGGRPNVEINLKHNGTVDREIEVHYVIVKGTQSFLSMEQNGQCDFMELSRRARADDEKTTFTTVAVTTAASAGGDTTEIQTAPTTLGVDGTTVAGATTLGVDGTTVAGATTLGVDGTTVAGATTVTIPQPPSGSKQDPSGRNDNCSVKESTNTTCCAFPSRIPVRQGYDIRDNGILKFKINDQASTIYAWFDLVSKEWVAYPETQVDDLRLLSNANGGFREDGPYTIYLEWMKSDLEISGSITFMNKFGCLSADIYLLRNFYLGMMIVYLLSGLLWGALMAIRHQDLLQLQFYILGVIIIGFLEMIICFVDLDYWNKECVRSTPLMVFGKLVWAFKGTVSRVLVLVVAMGYGVVKPRLGEVKKQIAAVSVVAFIFYAAYGISEEAQDQNHDEANADAMMMIIIPVSVLDAAIFWWIFFSLHHTMAVLNLRKNIVKLTLYRRFQFALGCCVLATIIFTIYVLTKRATKTPGTPIDGVEDPAESEELWRNAWFINWGFWCLLFYSILVTIMFLFRPTMNNARYAYAALDTDFQDDPEVNGQGSVPHFGAETMKSRTHSARGREPPRKRMDDIEEELTWVEENIPSTITSTDNNFLNFPMDSDEEIMNRFEVSKME